MFCIEREVGTLIPDFFFFVCAVSMTMFFCALCSQRSQPTGSSLPVLLALIGASLLELEMLSAIPSSHVRVMGSDILFKFCRFVLGSKGKFRIAEKVNGLVRQLPVFI